MGAKWDLEIVDSEDECEPKEGEGSTANKIVTANFKNQNNDNTASKGKSRSSAAKLSCPAENFISPEFSHNRLRALY